ncbi:HAD hydrolase-like protein [Pusillimonas sp. (ex Stolz et al. 2005)]|uniref:HAD-IIA family hydrolase n=1 Tax=Pusillimonas sp. (ex Stolz et al. 2005) TaxID=1979962 RepID=UPI00262EA3D1|nr:HAD hydrolase-like protein [Pusillimonas sp. (ex Stolz et al. 2005)]
MIRAGSSTDLNAVKGFIFDIDGTLALADRHLSGYQALPGAADLIELLRNRGTPYLAFTNGSTKTPSQLSNALCAAGLNVADFQALTPPAVAVSLFKNKGYKRLLVLGTEGVYKPLADAGLDIVVSPDRADDADAVLIGWYPEFRLADLEAACRAVWNGAGLYTVSTAPFLASREGRTLGISGALTAAVSSVTGAEATIVGKPAAAAFEVARSMLGLQPQEIAIVGDDLSLENAMAHENGAISVAVHTGLTSPRDIEQLPAHLRPHCSLTGVDELLALIA